MGEPEVGNEVSIEIARLYVSFFNRAPDPEGVQYWMNRYAEAVANGFGADLFLEEIADSFAQSPEAKAIYEQQADPGRAEIEAYITEAYQNMFGRTPDAEGLKYWADRWETEMAEGQPGVRVLFEIENAARGSTNQNDIDALNNKAEVAAKFTTDFISSGVTWTTEDFEKAQTIVDDVDHTDDSVQQANDQIDQYIEEQTGGSGPVEPTNRGGSGKLDSGISGFCA
ncbi:DUF4214 domain-containing protein [Devosia sp. RR2S18]|uniref:DUF4214 domain-containing protein n=1 Tax=Devosia rhizosphaerae TaxID=3049774 RepID=UPI002541A308|nr:DUF4214 domain-containing protein [Devosia sp. RR2S18]WIJ26579.1 DUF4214 domain-containing protein [Devosia sp. RR2S18]